MKPASTIMSLLSSNVREYRASTIPALTARAKSIARRLGPDGTDGRIFPRQPLNCAVGRAVVDNDDFATR